MTTPSDADGLFPRYKQHRYEIFANPNFVGKSANPAVVAKLVEQKSQEQQQAIMLPEAIPLGKAPSPPASSSLPVAAAAVVPPPPLPTNATASMASLQQPKVMDASLPPPPPPPSSSSNVASDDQKKKIESDNEKKMLVALEALRLDDDTSQSKSAPIDDDDDDGENEPEEEPDQEESEEDGGEQNQDEEEEGEEAAEEPDDWDRRVYGKTRTPPQRRPHRRRHHRHHGQQQRVSLPPPPVSSSSSSSSSSSDTEESDREEEKKHRRKENRRKSKSTVLAKEIATALAEVLQQQQKQEAPPIVPKTAEDESLDRLIADMLQEKKGKSSVSRDIRTETWLKVLDLMKKQLRDAESVSFQDAVEDVRERLMRMKREGYPDLPKDLEEHPMHVSHLSQMEREVKLYDEQRRNDLENGVDDIENMVYLASTALDGLSTMVSPLCGGRSLLGRKVPERMQKFLDTDRSKRLLRAWVQRKRSGSAYHDEARSLLLGGLRVLAEGLGKQAWTSGMDTVNDFCSRQDKKHETRTTVPPPVSAIPLPTPACLVSNQSKHEKKQVAKQVAPKTEPERGSLSRVGSKLAENMAYMANPPPLELKKVNPDEPMPQVKDVPSLAPLKEFAKGQDNDGLRSVLSNVKRSMKKDDEAVKKQADRKAQSKQVADDTAHQVTQTASQFFKQAVATSTTQ